MGIEGKSFGSEHESVGNPQVFEQLAKMISNKEIIVGGEIPPIDPEGGSLAKLPSPNNPFEGTGIELAPPQSESTIAWTGGVGIGKEVQLDLVASNK
ncbi:MAG: hypothetical protein U0524_03575 [Candidatus Saccharimonadales bacterium]